MEIWRDEDASDRTSDGVLGTTERDHRTTDGVLDDLDDLGKGPLDHGGDPGNFVTACGIDLK